MIIAIPAPTIRLLDALGESVCGSVLITPDTLFAGLIDISQRQNVCFPEGCSGSSAKPLDCRRDGGQTTCRR